RRQGASGTRGGEPTPKAFRDQGQEAIFDFRGQLFFIRPPTAEDPRDGLPAEASQQRPALAADDVPPSDEETHPATAASESLPAGVRAALADRERLVAAETAARCGPASPQVGEPEERDPPTGTNAQPHATGCWMRISTEQLLVSLGSWFIPLASNEVINRAVQQHADGEDRRHQDDDRTAGLAVATLKLLDFRGGERLRCSRGPVLNALMPAVMGMAHPYSLTAKRPTE